MSLYAKLLLMGADDVTAGDPPSGAPTSVATTTYAGVLIRVTWTNADATAQTAVYLQQVGEDILLGYADAGATSYDTGAADAGTYGCAHFKNGQYSATTYES